MNSKVMIHVLTDENYHTWVNKMKMLLKLKGFWKFIKTEVKSETMTILLSEDPKGKDHEENLVDDEKALQPLFGSLIGAIPIGPNQ